MKNDPKIKRSYKKAFLYFSGIAICISLFLSNSTTVFATWKKIVQFPTTVNASFFFNEQKGFIAMDGVNGIKRTTDGGQTWSACLIPTGYTGFFTDIFMQDTLRGWATIEADDIFAHGLWSTTDGGLSWQIVSNVEGMCSSVFKTPSSLIITDRNTLNRLSTSSDNGAHFTRVSLDKFTGIDFADNLHGVAVTFATGAANGTPGTALFTADGGLTWQKTSGVMVEAWSVYAQKGSSNFVIAGEKYAGDASTSQNVFGSTDYGATWQVIAVLPGRTTGHIEGVGTLMYVQSQAKFPNSPSFQGLDRSTHGGKTWKNVGGPENYRDTRFSVTGCMGGVVYAFDESGGVWKTTDGGDGSFPDALHSPTLSANQVTLIGNPCIMDTVRLSYSNFSCNPLKITSIGFTDSANSVISSGALSFIRYPKLPQTLNSAASDSLTLVWDPKKLGALPLTSTVNLKIRSTSASGAEVFDTVVIVNLGAFTPQPSSHPDSLSFFSSKLKELSCRTVVLHNTLHIGEPAFTVQSANFTHTDPAYTVGYFSSSLPAGITAQDSLTFEVCFMPQDTLIRKDTLILTTDCMIFTISLEGQGATGLIFASDLNFGSVKVGDTLCKNILIKNTGRASFTLTDAFDLSDTINFSVANQFPLSINAGDSVPVLICFHPKLKGPFNADITWSTDLEIAFKYSIKSNSALSGNSKLSVPKYSKAKDVFSIRPNPAHNDLEIHINSGPEAQTQIEIFDVLGKCALSRNQLFSGGMNILHLNITDLPAGVYVLKIGNEKQNFVKE